VTLISVFGVLLQMIKILYKKT